MSWRFIRKIRAGDGGTFLSLLIRAQQIDANDASVAAAFRAGLRVGAEHPEVVAWLDATKEKNDG